MNTNTMPLEAETRVLIDRSLENLGNSKGKIRMYFLNNLEQNQREKSWMASVRIMFYILRIVINR